MKASNLIDKPWAIMKDRAKKSAKLLADFLLKGIHGNRPVSLIGYSVGARLIFHSLLELADHKAYGIVHSVYLIGAPIGVSDMNEWKAVRSVVAGRMVNVYSNKDWALAFLMRDTALSLRSAGLAPVVLTDEFTGQNMVENFDVSDIVGGHFEYMRKLGEVVQCIGLKSSCILYPGDVPRAEKEHQAGHLRGLSERFREMFSRKSHNNKGTNVDSATSTNSEMSYQSNESA
eukprot:GEZU01008504.1.p1 GENE.GEZU01008504.1~~GEZU01008504.1.p1  ORF type:complete len:231 (-),score=27.19 GEZU01008504.1:8-700(-)